MPPRPQVNSATGIMGKTGSGKSALLATLARAVWERWHKTTDYYNSDGGGFPAAIQELQAIGIIRVFRMRTRDPGDLGLSFETLYRAYQGWWPKVINPTTGEVPQGVEMVPPVALRFTLSCPAGHVLKTVPSESLIVPTVCNTCKRPITKTEMQVKRDLVVNSGFETRGAVCFDGLSSALAWEMMEMGHRAGRLELKGEEGAIGGKVVSGSLKFGGVTRSHVGFAQTRGEELVHLTLGIPNLVVPPVITMLTHEDVDERGLNITGPKIAGRAKTDEAPQWFGNLLETDKVPALDGSVGEQRVVYLKEFTDQTGRRHLCKIRGNPGTMPALLADPIGGDEDPTKAFTQFNLGLFFGMLDQALNTSIDRAKAQYPDAPGLAEGWVTIGDASIVTPPPAETPALFPAATAEAATLTAPVIPQAAPTPKKAAKPRAVAPPPATAPAAPVTLERMSSPIVTMTPIVTMVEDPDAATTPVPPAPLVPTPPVATSTPAPAPPPPVPPAAGPAPVSAARPVAAPPPGRRPSAAPAGTRPQSVPVPPVAAATQVPLPPAGAISVTGPATPARPVAAAPRPPAAAPRPPAPAPRPRAAGSVGAPEGEIHQ